MDFWQYCLLPDDGSPDEVGWYPVLICHDIQGKPSSGATYWDGQIWDGQSLGHGSVFAYGCRQADGETAERLACDNNPGAWPFSVRVY